MQKRDPAGTWSSLGSYRTKGNNERRTVNLPKGHYRVVVAAQHGYQATRSPGVFLVR